MTLNISKLESIYIYIYIYIYITYINHTFLCYSKFLHILCDHPYIYYRRLNKRFTTVLHERSFPSPCQLPVAILYVPISYALCVPRSRHSSVNIRGLTEISRCRVWQTDIVATMMCSFLYGGNLWIDFDLPCRHFRWRYKQSNIENTIKFLLITLWYTVRYWVWIYVSLKVYIYIYIYIYKYHTFLFLLLISPHSLRLSVYQLSPSKLEFHNSPAIVIVSFTMPVASGDFFA